MVPGRADEGWERGPELRVPVVKPLTQPLTNIPTGMGHKGPLRASRRRAAVVGRCRRVHARAPTLVGPGAHRPDLRGATSSPRVALPVTQSFPEAAWPPVWTEVARGKRPEGRPFARPLRRSESTVMTAGTVGPVLAAQRTRRPGHRRPPLPTTASPQTSPLTGPARPGRVSTTRRGQVTSASRPRCVLLFQGRAAAHSPHCRLRGSDSYGFVPGTTSCGDSPSPGFGPWPRRPLVAFCRAFQRTGPGGACLEQGGQVPGRSHLGALIWAVLDPA